MKIHEYQAKEIFREAGIPVPPGRVATSVAEAIAIAEEISRPVMIKAQVHVGGRGKAGGIKYAENVESAKIWAQRILGMDIKGLQVKKVLVTEATEIATVPEPIHLSGTGIYGQGALLNSSATTAGSSGAVTLDIWRGTPVEQVISKSLRADEGRVATVVNVYSPPGKWRREAPPELLEIVGGQADAG